MLKIINVAIILSLSLSQLAAQNQSDSIEVRKGAFGTRFMQNGTNLKIGQLMDITRSNEESYEEMKIAKRNYVTANVFGMPGGFMVGWPVGTAIGGGEPNWTLAGIGAGLIVLQIPFASAFTRHAKNAVRIYNAGLKPVNDLLKTESPAAAQDSVLAVPAAAKSEADLASMLYYTPADSSYKNYLSRLETALKQDKKIISYEFREHKYGNGNLKSRGCRAKHHYGFNEDFSYLIGTWEYYAKDGTLEKTMNYNLREQEVK